jgi:hypothetical protein
MLLIKDGEKMKRSFLTILLITGFLVIMAIPSFAMSNLANRFIKACTALDAPFPPTDWDRGDLRDASIEVLNNIERGDFAKWPTDFCLKALGYTAYPEDLNRILAYEKSMPYTVLRALKGFEVPEAVDLLIKYLDDKEPTKRASAAWSLSGMDFREFDKPSEWKSKVLSAIKAAKSNEKQAWLKKDYDKVLKIIESGSQTTS